MGRRLYVQPPDLVLDEQPGLPNTVIAAGTEHISIRSSIIALVCMLVDVTVWAKDGLGARLSPFDEMVSKLPPTWGDPALADLPKLRATLAMIAKR